MTPHTNPPPLLVSYAEAARLLGKVSTRHVERLVAARELRAVGRGKARPTVASRVASHAETGKRGLPAALAPFADERRWVVWRYGPARKGGKRPKLPYHPVTGALFSGDAALAPGAGGTYADAAQALRRGVWRTCDDGRRYPQRCDGIGIILGDGLVGLDFDDCIAAGVLAPRVRQDVEALDSYAEISPSGAGVKVLALGELPSSWKTDYCEGYAGDRFFTITFRQLEGTPDAVQPAPEALASLWTLWARRSTPRGPQSAGEARLSPLALAPAGFWQEVSYWERHRSRLIRSDDLPFGMSPQLRDLVEHNRLPAALAAKGDTASERRALVVRQLRRRGWGYDDAQAYVIARAVWRKLGLDTKSDRDLQADALRLILVESPLALEHTHPGSQRRTLDCQRALARDDAPPTPPPVAPAPATPRRAPATPESYLAILTAAAVSGVVVEGRRERAELADISEKTAQRLEAKLETEGAIRVKLIRTGAGRQSVVQILNRINGPETPLVEHPAADVQTPPSDGIREPETARETPVCIEGQDTVCPAVPAFDVRAWLRRCAEAPMPAPAAPAAPQAPRTPPVSCPPEGRPSFTPAAVGWGDALRLVKRERLLAARPSEPPPVRPVRQQAIGFLDDDLAELAAILELRDDGEVMLCAD